jgi:hypothetical protein
MSTPTEQQYSKEKIGAKRVRIKRKLLQRTQESIGI